ncbi:PREDICTED: uncharacterized protein LOC108368022 [Rhagoletis zephyria]|uniref:uncharacterized protein LOC108368022 n=1 Tax=Rhagoletis zephyria TaxID=28612 RepID=UPI0008112D1E|nr:PREDICTED: uncharacterized protein LOC108368022 [Rhagoletis zephyria]
MYRQVRVSSKHVDLQRIVWRPDPSSPVRDYRMLRVTYGVAAASHLAVKALQQTAKCSTNGCKKAVDAILNDFYMDDLLTGASCKSELRSKFFKNAASNYGIDGKDVHSLGLTWNIVDDYFTFAVDLKKPPTILTKRAFLSDASTLFDPLGLLAPVTICSKMWFQNIWRAEVGWDDLIPDTIANLWLDHREQLQQLVNLKRAYAAVMYARTVHSDGLVTVSIISSKTKVAPIKTTSLPHLEPCAVHLAAKLVRSVLYSWGDLRYPLFAWTDSTITLAWLQVHPSRWETFVANRVADIHEILPPECWNHVRSEGNPADCASRGITLLKLLHHEQWWNGPEFLSSSNQFWKQGLTKTHVTELGVRKKVHAHVTNSDIHWSMTKY